jgi:4-amino-4-deoxy-L-arabinose transferase-like glycosyltransferase
VTRDRGPILAALALALLALLLFLPRLGSLPLIDPDEGRYASAARTMTETRDWVVPRFNGAPRLNKPPLAYWLQAAFMRPLGPGELAARLPSVLALSLVLAALWATGRSRAEPWSGLLAGLVVVASPLGFAGFHLATTDGVMSALLALALLSSLAVREERLPLLPGTLLAASALGLAVLAKGHVPLVVFLAIQAAFLLLRGRDSWRRPGAAALLAGAVLVILPVLPWLLAVGVRVGWGPLTETALDELGRVSSGSDHPESWYYYLLRSPVFLFPWTGLVLVALVEGWRRRRETAVAFALAWTLVPLLVFSLSSGKNNLYLLPALPGTGLLVGLVWAHRRSEAALGDRRRLLVAAMVAALLAAMGAAYLGTYHGTGAIVTEHRAALIALVLLFSAAALGAAWTRRGRALLAVLALGGAALLLGALLLAPEVLGGKRHKKEIAEAFLTGGQAPQEGDR